MKDLTQAQTATDIRINALLSTSVDDCKCSVAGIQDVRLLNLLAQACKDRGHISREKVVRARLNALLKGLKEKQEE